MSNYENEAFDWTSEIEEDGKTYVTVEPGDYTFTVKAVERQNYQGSDKIPACNLVIVSGEIDVPNGVATFKERLYLLKRYEWKLSGFFRCLGMKKHGEKLRMDFPGTVGKKGYAKFSVREYDGKTYNQIDRYYDYDPANMEGGFKGVKDDETPW